MKSHIVIPVLACIGIALMGPVVAVVTQASPAISFLIGLPFGALGVLVAMVLHDRLRRTRVSRRG